MASSFHVLIIAGLMMGRGALCLPQHAQPGLVDPPTITTKLLPSMITSPSSLVTHKLEPNTTTTYPPVDRTNANSQTMTTITRSDGRIQTLTVPYPMPSIIDPRPPEDDEGHTTRPKPYPMPTIVDPQPPEDDDDHTSTRTVPYPMPTFTVPQPPENEGH
ncbi:hypothetical protein FJTKL_06223 [Diaporthe vaccinii]|uniref:Uncharacterized protein n=1 Tax=Diaporthe vaccinii TaxID=105482 RepID=A0ABR4DQV1_9PEZI